MQAVKALNLAIRFFVVELGALAGAAYWGFESTSGAGQLWLTVLAPVVVIVVWGLFISPKARIRIPRPAALVIELVHLKVDLIVTAGSPVTRAVKQATSTIPIVMALDPDPVGNGFVASLARPGGNITGLSALSPQLSGKQLELLKEIDSKLSRVAVLGSSTRPGNAQILK